MSPGFPSLTKQRRRAKIVLLTILYYILHGILIVGYLSCDVRTFLNRLTNAVESGEERFNSQYWRANVQPTERYVLSTVGSKFCRLRSDDCGFGNLYLAGDWTLNGLNAGSVEAAVMSGIQAAQGESGCQIEILGGYEAAAPAPCIGRRPASLDG